jgi:hypothetical protein
MAFQGLPGQGHQGRALFGGQRLPVVGLVLHRFLSIKGNGAISHHGGLVAGGIAAVAVMQQHAVASGFRASSSSTPTG